MVYQLTTDDVGNISNSDWNYLRETETSESKKSRRAASRRTGEHWYGPKTREIWAAYTQSWRSGQDDPRRIWQTPRDDGRTFDREAPSVAYPPTNWSGPPGTWLNSSGIIQVFPDYEFLWLEKFQPSKRSSNTDINSPTA
ncbi:hypothetical protein V866_001237 [Kwoniella sp. B9012]